MPLTIKNSPANTAQKPVVNINGEDFLLSELNTLTRDATGVRASAEFEDVLTPYPTPAAGVKQTA